ncbi:hypothetical protein IE53DRAFT_30189 [Violaceomyces palustris]|uniref:Uncharacterized protein n=1 Tax=Violaceomyces palustris TaxID=1673888 RepID=A0ACD0P1B8_9BASI|nr:hypothetical protein IE53DRAFT_30189 [Violaceomyces palustris]
MKLENPLPLLLLLLSPLAAAASSDSNPILAFTSRSVSEASSHSILSGLNRLSSSAPSSIRNFDLIHSFFGGNDDERGPELLCQLDSILILKQQATGSLQRESFARLGSEGEGGLKKMVLDSPAQIVLDLGRQADQAVDLGQSFKSQLERFCGESTKIQLVRSDLERHDLEEEVLQQPGEGVVILDIDVDNIVHHENRIEELLKGMDEKLSDNLVLILADPYKTTPASTWIHKRSEAGEAPSSSQPSQGEWTEPRGGIFHKYQLFSTPLIICLLVSFGVLSPIILFATYLLASIQTPDQIGQKKISIGSSKKNN